MNIFKCIFESIANAFSADDKFLRELKAENARLAEILKEQRKEKAAKSVECDSFQVETSTSYLKYAWDMRERGYTPLSREEYMRRHTCN